MSAIGALRRLRHGHLKKLGPMWVLLGKAYRRACHWGIRRYVPQSIGPYGPFLLEAQFAFSNFENWGGGHNSGFQACVEACRGATCVMDIGGHIGLVTLPMSRVIAPGGRVYSFEPSTANLACLRSHLAANGIDNVEVIDSLVGDSDASAIPFFEEAQPSGQNGLAIKGHRTGFAQTEHSQVSLDNFCQRHALNPQVIKIDVEGAECNVLRGAAETLNRCRPRIFLSVHPAHLAMLGSSVDEMLALLDEVGYVCREIDGTEVRSFRLDEYLLLPKETVKSC